jgi:YbbR domain-containing protein
MKFVSLTRLIMAIFLAVVIWGYVTFSQNPDREISRTERVEAVNLSSEFLILNNELPRVEIKVRGSRDKVDFLPSTLRPYIDLAGVKKAGLQSFKVLVDMPEGVRATISPDNLEVQIDEYSERSLDFELVQRGIVNNQLTVVNVTPSVTQIKLSGAKSLVDKVKQIRAVYDVSKFGFGTSEQEVPLTLYGDNDQVIIPENDLKFTPQNIVVRATVQSQLNSKSVPVVIVQKGQPAPGYIAGDITKDPAVVTIVSSDRTIIEGTGAVDFVQTEPVDISGATSRIITTTKLVPSGNYTILEALEVRVTIDIAPQQATSTVNVPLRVEGVGVNLISDVSPLTITVVLNGPYSALATINLDNIEAKLDLRGRDAGEYRLPVQITIPDGITVANNPMVTVRLTRRATPTPLPTPTFSPTPSPTATTTPAATETTSPTNTPPVFTPTPTTPNTGQGVSPRPDPPVTNSPELTPAPPTSLTPTPSPTRR